ncbi:DUF6461 domain-containing protein [Streptomyces sp. NPDC086549]|uniref:DUF6461 domain-containing protein n=1 Tax=Streptomyces sp. NPDC086549 TaxID=3365752 RepID=UPI00381C440A
MMSSDRVRGLDFFRGDVPIYTLTFAKQVSPEELLTRMGADPDSVVWRDVKSLHDEYGDTLLDEDEPVVTTGIDGAWTWAWEQGGMHGLDERILCAVSEGTEAVVLHYNEKPMYWFKYAVDGDVLVDFHTLGPLELTGPTPQQLDEAMQPLGLVPGQPVPLHNVLSLAETAFGLRVTPAEDDEERWSGNLLALPERP